MAVLANVTQEILKAAEEEVSKIKADAKAEADRILWHVRSSESGRARPPSSR